MLNYTAVVTSCGRFDLLEATLRSFLAHADIQPSRILVIEDSGDRRVDDVVARLPARCDTVVNEYQLGQMRSIDKAYSHVETEWVFHCEDDWEFFRSGFIGQSATVLKAHPEISLVALRPREEFNKLVRNAPTEITDGVAWVRFDPGLHPEYFGYSFNPGLRRMSDYRRLAPLADIGGELLVSLAFKKAGFHYGNLEEPAVRHIGDGRHVHDPMQRKRPTNRLERLKRSIEKRVDRFNRWRHEKMH